MLLIPFNKKQNCLDNIIISVKYNRQYTMDNLSHEQLLIEYV